jgi:hypothetical protein
MINRISGFETLTAVVKNVVIFWDIAPGSPYMNLHFGRTYHLHLQGRKSPEEEISVGQAILSSDVPFTYGIHRAISQKTVALKSISVPMEEIVTYYGNKVSFKSKYFMDSKLVASTDTLIPVK